MKTSILFSSLLICLLASFSLAFSDSTPLLAFSSHINHFLDKAIPDLLSSTPKSPVSYSDQIANALKGSKRKGLCGIDAVAIFEVQGKLLDLSPMWKSSNRLAYLVIPVALATQLHSNSFRQSSSSSLKDLALSSPSHYAIQNVQGGSLSNRVRHSVLKECRSSGWGESRIQEVDQWNQVGNKKVFVVKADGVHDESDLHQHLEALSSSHPNHLVVITSPEIPDPRLQKRSFESRKADKVQHGLFYRYQFFSTPILVCLLVLFTVLIPPVYVALKMLAALQTPDKLGEKGRAPTADKKNA